MSFQIPPVKPEDYVFWGIAVMSALTLGMMLLRSHLGESANPGRKGPGTQWYFLAILAGVALGFWFYHQQPLARRTQQSLATFLIAGLCAGVVIGGFLDLLTRPNTTRYEDRDPRAEKAKGVMALVGFGGLFVAMFFGAQWWFR